jgi:transcriptional regulator with XRE-family HTH domain
MYPTRTTGVKESLLIACAPSNLFVPAGYRATLAKQIEDDYAAIGRRILDARLRAGLTQAELGRRIGHEGPTVARWESGENRIYAATLRRIARELGVTVAHLYGDDEGEPNDAFSRAARAATPDERDAGAAFLETMRRRRTEGNRSV